MLLPSLFPRLRLSLKAKAGARTARPRIIPAGLCVRSFSSYPALAEYCRRRMTPRECDHFAYGIGSAFMHLLDFMAENSAGQVGLLAVGMPDPLEPGELKTIKWVVAHCENARSPLDLGRGTKLLYGSPPEA